MSLTVGYLCMYVYTNLQQNMIILGDAIENQSEQMIVT